MATTKITSPDLFDLESLNTALKLPSGTTAERPTSPSTGEWRYNTTTNLVEFWDGGEWRDLQSENIPPINSENFNTVIWSGDDTDGREITVGFKPDFVWIKPRNLASANRLFDSTRGATKFIISDSTSAEQTASSVLQSFTSTGFTVGISSGVNESPYTYVAWCWKANGGTTSSNTDGSITSTVQANTKAAFSIVKWTGTGAQGTIGHGLSAAPELIFSKRLDSANNWNVYQKDLSLSHSTYPDWLYLNLDSSQQNSGSSANHPYYQAPSSTLIYQNTGTSESSNVNGGEYISYCFASVAGYSSIGTYTGNGAITGPLVNTGFEPAMIIIKEYDGVDNWAIVDNKRSTTNPRQNWLRPNLNNAEFDNGVDSIIFLSNGFQIGGGSSASGFLNENGKNYIYIAFGSDASAAPALADSFTNVLYTGNGSTQSITGLGFSPSLVWQKERGQAVNHRWIDTVRGATNAISSSLTVAEFAESTGLTSFDADGFTVGSNVDYNNNGGTFVAWNWKANPIPTINTDGTIQSVVSANQAAGFSIVKWNGTGSAGTVGHGLSAAPEIILTKRLNGTGDWYSFSTALNSGTNPAYNFIKLNSSDSEIVNGSSGGSIWNSTSPTATVINVGTTLSGSTSDSYIAYCFTSIAGFSKMGTYTGTGATHAITGVGFQPDWIMGKEVNGTDSWEIVDSARGINKMVYANGANAEVTNTNFTSFDSDGFTLSSATSINQSGQTYLYMAFKENVTPSLPAGEAGFLVVAGGGGGGGGCGGRGGGGAGAGGLRTSIGSTSGGGSSAESNITLASGTYTITIGTGGATGSNCNAGGTGNNSSITGSVSITSDGGGYSGSGTIGGGGAGGSGGSGYDGGGAATANQGYPGIRSLFNSTYWAGGGGGAASRGNTVQNNGSGGAGLQVNGTFYAGGGGTGQSNQYGSGDGGTGGGGEGQNVNYYTTPVDGDANTGGGGGGGTYTSSGVPGTTRGGQGGSGVVILQMNAADYSGNTTGSPTVSAAGGLVTLTYTGSGTYVHS